MKKSNLLAVFVLLLGILVFGGQRVSAAVAPPFPGGFLVEPATDVPTVTLSGSDYLVSFHSYIDKANSAIPDGGIVGDDQRMKRFFWVEDASGTQVSGAGNPQYFGNQGDNEIDYQSNPFDWAELGFLELRCITPEGEASSLYCPSSSESDVIDTFTMPAAGLPAGYKVCTRLISRFHYGFTLFGYTWTDTSREYNGWEDMFGNSGSQNPTPDPSVQDDDVPAYGISPKKCATVGGGGGGGPSTFTLVPKADAPVLTPDAASPTSVAFNNTGVNSSNTPNAAGVNATIIREYYIVRNAGGTTVIATLNDPRSVVNPGVTYPPNNYALTGANAVNPGDQVCVKVSVNPSQGQMNASGAVTRTDAGLVSTTPSCITIAFKPYFRAYGGDMLVGSGFGDGCVANPNAQLLAFNDGTGIGSAAQLAAQASGIINGFTTATQAGGAPKRLSFSNNAGNATYGGSFGTGQCLPDYFANRPADIPLTAGVSLDINNPSAFQNMDATVAHDRTIYINGTVRIRHNITYNGAAWFAGTIPSFKIVVRGGNIYIDPGVTQLDGVYVAQPSYDAMGNPVSGTGVIYTCSNGAGFAAPSTGAEWDACDNQKLTINGALLAQRLRLLRTGGTVGNSAANHGVTDGRPGEVINYSPDIWMGAPPAGSTTQGNYDAITSLPPVL